MRAAEELFGPGKIQVVFFASELSPPGGHFANQLGSTWKRPARGLSGG